MSRMMSLINLGIHPPRVFIHNSITSSIINFCSPTTYQDLPVAEYTQSSVRTINMKEKKMTEIKRISQSWLAVISSLIGRATSPQLLQTIERGRRLIGWLLPGRVNDGIDPPRLPWGESVPCPSWSYQGFGVPGSARLSCSGLGWGSEGMGAGLRRAGWGGVWGALGFVGW